MQQLKNVVHLCVLISGLFLTGCDESAKPPAKNDMDTASTGTNKDVPAMPAYDAAMDPLTVGAQFSKKIHDTLNIKLFEVTLKPGDSIALHTHPDHSIYVLQGGKLSVNIQGTGTVEFDLKPGMGWVGGPVTDFGKNIGNTTVKWIETDVYRPRDK